MPDEASTSTSTSVSEAATPVASPPPEAPLGAPAKTAASSDLTFPDQDTLNTRLNRHHVSKLKKDYGIEDPDALKSQLAELKELKSAKEIRDREAMSTQERLETDLKSAESAREAMVEQMNEMRFESHVKGICAEMGVTNVDYAMFEVARAAEKVGENEQLDVKEHLTNLMEKGQSRAALGLPATAQVVQTPETSTPDGYPPEPNVIRNQGPPDVNKMSKAEFKQHLAGQGVGLTG